MAGAVQWKIRSRSSKMVDYLVANMMELIGRGHKVCIAFSLPVLCSLRIEPLLVLKVHLPYDSHIMIIPYHTLILAYYIEIKYL